MCKCILGLASPHGVSLEAGNSPQDIVHCQHSLLYISHRAKEDRLIVLCNSYLETSELRRWDPLGELFRDCSKRSGLAVPLYLAARMAQLKP